MIRDVPFFSTDEATLLPFYGVCHVGYVPSRGDHRGSQQGGARRGRCSRGARPPKDSRRARARCSSARRPGACAWCKAGRRWRPPGRGPCSRTRPSGAWRVPRAPRTARRGGTRASRSPSSGRRAARGGGRGRRPAGGPAPDFRARRFDFGKRGIRARRGVRWAPRRPAKRRRRRLRLAGRGRAPRPNTTSDDGGASTREDAHAVRSVRGGRDARPRRAVRRPTTFGGGGATNVGVAARSERRAGGPRPVAHYPRGWASPSRSPAMRIPEATGALPAPAGLGLAAGDPDRGAGGVEDPAGGEPGGERRDGEALEAKRAERGARGGAGAGRRGAAATVWRARSRLRPAHGPRALCRRGARVRRRSGRRRAGTRHASADAGGRGRVGAREPPFPRGSLETTKRRRRTRFSSATASSRRCASTTCFRSTAPFTWRRGGCARQAAVARRGSARWRGSATGSRCRSGSRGTSRGTSRRSRVRPA